MRTIINPLSPVLKIAAILSFCIIISSCQQTDKRDRAEDDSFSFVFMTDIHLEPEKNAPEGFRQAIDTVNKLNPDFVITGGDLIMDALGAKHSRADSLYKMYDEMKQLLQMPVYNTVGNHELFGIYPESGADSTHPDYNLNLFKKYFGEPYYSFDHNGWHFMVLNSIIPTSNRKYRGYIDPKQREWIKTDLEKTDRSAPIVISTHIPFISVQAQWTGGALTPNSKGLVIENSKEVLDLFSEHNLKLVLQGHLHFLECISINNEVTFITGGAVSAKWWDGPRAGMEEGFLLIRLNGQGKIDWKYIDYGWEVKC